jgi:hypothetical protein
VWIRWWTFGFHKKAGYFLTSRMTISFSNNILHHGVSEWEWVSKSSIRTVNCTLRLWSVMK